jgi:XrtJ-associated TM-motif-TM protein
MNRDHAWAVRILVQLSFLDFPHLLPLIEHDRDRFEDIMNAKKTLMITAFATILTMALPLRAQTGCTDSPEDPTLVLALLGAAGAFVTAVGSSWNRKN